MSSYAENNYRLILKSLVEFYNPKLIVEFGILHGYSLDCFIESASSDCKIFAYDIFDDFVGKSAEWKYLDKYKDSKCIIRYGDFYQRYNDFGHQTVDLFHIDIANDGDVYQFFFDNYIDKLTTNGIGILEGGSYDRDRCDWMLRYNKSSIANVLDKYRQQYDIYTFCQYPSLTIVKRKL